VEIVSMAGRGRSSSSDVTDWHRLFGIVLTEFFAGSDWEVVRELDLSIKQQLLDIVIVRRGRGHKTPVLPDGFSPLADHNLVTYKSLHEPLDGWALKELVGHSVNYRKQVSPSLDRLLPEESFRLLAVVTRFPEKMAGKITLQLQGVGVYDVAWGTDTIRVLVLNEVPAADHNAVLNLFSAEPQRVVAGAVRCRSVSREFSFVLEELIETYLGESDMPQTLDEMIRDSAERFMAKISPSRLVEIMPQEMLVEAQTLIARRLAKMESKTKSSSPRRPSGHKAKRGKT
jgi:hypothetical protein